MYLRYLVPAQQIRNWCTFNFSVGSPIYINFPQFSRWKCPDPIFRRVRRARARKIWSEDETDPRTGARGVSQATPLQRAWLEANLQAKPRKGVACKTTTIATSRRTLVSVVTKHQVNYLDEEIHYCSSIAYNQEY